MALVSQIHVLWVPVDRHPSHPVYISSAYTARPVFLSSYLRHSGPAFSFVSSPSTSKGSLANNVMARSRLSPSPSPTHVNTPAFATGAYYPVRPYSGATHQAHASRASSSWLVCRCEYLNRRMRACRILGLGSAPYSCRTHRLWMVTWYEVAGIPT